MEVDVSIETFYFSIYVLGSTRRPTTVKFWPLQRILTPSLITATMFALVVPYFFDVCFVHKNYECLGQKIAAVMPFVNIRLYKRHDLS